MANVEIKVFENVSEKDRLVFQEFSDKNWGASEISPEEEKIIFFEIPSIWIVGYINNKIVGLFDIHVREISFEGRRILLAGIGGVVTRVDRRRQGVMSQILDKFFSKYISRYKFDMAMLCADMKKVGKLYGRIGFMPINRPYFFLDKNGKEREEAWGMILGLNNKAIVAKILSSKTKLFVGESNF